MPRSNRRCVSASALFGAFGPTAIALLLLLTQTATAAEPAAETVTLKTADKTAFDALLKTHRGKVVVVDYWATWCVPCVKDFPKTVAWTKSLPKDQVVVITMSLDDLENQERALSFLKKQQATGVNLISQTGADDKSFLDHGIDGGALPHFKVYDRQGKLFKKFGSEDPDASFDHKDVEAAIKAALSAGK